jgi:pyruvate kinase
LRSASTDAGRPCAVLLDLCGPKIRIGVLPGGGPLLLEPGDEIALVSEGFVPGPGEIPTTYPGLHADVKVGNAVLLADGRIRLRALKREEGRILTRVEEGGRLSERQGINLPGTDLSTPALSEKDLADLAYGADQGVDFVALSFVRKPGDVTACREALQRHGSSAPCIAKIEKPEAVERLDEILDASDGVMVARGDLAIEVSTARVPLLQKRILREAGRKALLAITATQMLESMTEKSLPTRAEAADVANAVLDGTDALMLSGETAVGRHPALTVRTMASIASEVEASPFFQERRARAFSEEDDSKDLSIAHAAYVACREFKADALVVYTESGSTARILSKFQPEVPIFALTPHAATLRRLQLVWGTEPIRIPFEKSVSDMIRAGEKTLLERSRVRPGDKIIITAGAVQVAGGTDMVKVSTVGGTAGE